MQNSHSGLPTPFLVVASPSGNISNPPDVSSVHPFVPPSSPAMMDKIKY
jgi:hypothetical protein